MYLSLTSKFAATVAPPERRLCTPNSLLCLIPILQSPSNMFSLTQV